MTSKRLPATTVSGPVTEASPGSSILGCSGSGSMTICSASARVVALSAFRKSPPVVAARHSTDFAVLSSRSKATTWAVKSTPLASRTCAASQGSRSQVSSPSVTRMTVAFLSVERSVFAANSTASVSGVMPFGWIALTVFLKASRSSVAGSTSNSMSPQSPLRRCP